jgi:hypothetical protein
VSHREKTASVAWIGIFVALKASIPHVFGTYRAIRNSGVMPVCSKPSPRKGAWWVAVLGHALFEDAKKKCKKPRTGRIGSDSFYLFF